MKASRNITRFTYEFTSFQGWRVTLCRNQIHFTRYFSDKQYGGERQSFEAAVRVRDHLLQLLHENPDEPVKAFQECRHIIPPVYPAGLRPRRSPILPPGHQGQRS